MRFLIEHPIYEPYTAISGGTELFVRHAARALRARGHHVEIFGSADSALPCIKPEAVSRRNCVGNVNAKRWYNDLGAAAAAFDVVILNTSLEFVSVMHPAHATWLSNAVYFNQNGSGWFVEGQGGRRRSSSFRRPSSSTGDSCAYRPAAGAEYARIHLFRS